MSFLDTLKAEIEQIFNTVTAFLGTFFNAAVQAVAAGGGQLLVQSAINAVTAAETAGGSGSDKFNAAKSAVIADLTAKGIPVITNAIHLAIEAAVANVKQDAASQ